jgi:hypothetical protein
MLNKFAHTSDLSIIFCISLVAFHYATRKEIIEGPIEVRTARVKRVASETAAL